MAKTKSYKTIDDIPLGVFNLTKICLKHGRRDKASQVLNAALVKVKDCPNYQVFQLTRKLMQDAGLEIR